MAGKGCHSHEQLTHWQVNIYLISFPWGKFTLTTIFGHEEMSCNHRYVYGVSMLNIIMTLWYKYTLHQCNLPAYAGLCFKLKYWRHTKTLFHYTTLGTNTMPIMPSEHTNSILFGNTQSLKIMRAAGGDGDGTTVQSAQSDLESEGC